MTTLCFKFSWVTNHHFNFERQKKTKNNQPVCRQKNCNIAVESFTKARLFISIKHQFNDFILFIQENALSSHMLFILALLLACFFSFFACMDSGTCCNQHPDLESATDVLPRGVSLGYELSDFTKGKKKVLQQNNYLNSYLSYLYFSQMH